MADNKKYYWLKLKEDFFDDDTISYIEEQENGILYVNFYLKLCLKSLKTEGSLIRLVGENLIPYDINSLAKLTKTPVDTVRVAMILFEKIGLVKILETGEIYLSQINEMIGSETDKASIMRRKRAQEKLKSNNVTEMLPKCYTEIDIDIEKEKDINRERQNKENVNKVVDLYNTICTKLPKVIKITDKRKKSIIKLLQDVTIEQFENICNIANNSEFLTGNNTNKWKADFDFMIRTDKAISILENKYTSTLPKNKFNNYLQREYENLNELYCNK